MSKRINDIPVQDLTYTNLTDNYKEMTLDEWQRAFIRLENHYKPIEKELSSTKHTLGIFKQKRWEHYKIIGWEKLLIILTFAITITTLINNACNN